jgi:hypothetical protein
MPTTTTGIATEFIQFTRASNATVTDSDGLVKWAPHNLLLNSESFDTSSWTKTTTTVAVNSIAAPNGTTTADTLTAAGANSTTLQSYTALAVPYTFGVWLRRKTGTGNIQIAADSGTYTTVTITSSWALYTVSQTPAAGTISAGIRIVTSADEIYVWGAALYRSDLSMQPNTSAYTLYNPTTPKNLVGFSESFDNAAWNKSNILAFGSGSVANAAVAPNGLQTADLLVPNTTSAAHTIFQNSTVGGLNVQALYVKPAGYTKIALRESQTGAYYAAFSLVGAGSVLDSSGATAAITALSDGWYRISMIGTISGTTRWSMYFLSPSYTSGSVIVSWTPDGTSGIYLWGAQLSDSASLDTYAPVYGAAVTSAAYYGPRRDFNASTLACNGLLVEEQRTNLWTNSNDFSAGSWVTSSATPTLNDAISPDGTMNAALITLSGTGGDQYIGGYETLTGTYTSSFWIKASDAGQVGKTIRFDTTGAGAASSTITLTASWQRITITNAPTGYFQVRLISASGFTASAFHLYGGQLELGSFATSYIPTIATATRIADIASVSTQAFPYSATEGTLVVSGDFSGVVDAPSACFVSMTDGTPTGSPSSSYVVLFKNTTLAVSGRRSTVGAATNIIVSNTTAANTVIKMGTAYSVNGTDALSVNGGAVATEAGVTSAYTDTVMRIGNFGVNPAFLNGHIRQITYLPRRISNAELVTGST